MSIFENPFKPGAGHAPPYLAGREKERYEFRKLLEQSCILENMILTGLRGVGKTVLLETLKPDAIRAGWMWAGTDLTESVSLNEDNIAKRIMTDLAPLVSNIIVSHNERRSIGFASEAANADVYLRYEVMEAVYTSTPGMPDDKLKAVLTLVWECLAVHNPSCKGVVLAYDEAQNLSDKKDKSAYPLSFILNVFQSIQRQGIPFLLVLTGLPTLFPKLVESRTYAERMFHVVSLERLTAEACKDAILKPISDCHECPVTFSSETIREIIDKSGGYPYFIQFFCHALFDSYLQQKLSPVCEASEAVEQVVRKLDADFFSGRWSNLTDRQRDLLIVIASLDNCDELFSVSDVASASRNENQKPFSTSHINQMLGTLGEKGLVYKNRYGKYSLAVPLLSAFIRRSCEGA